jgi:cell division septum initiation protein DivIVA
MQVVLTFLVSCPWRKRAEELQMALGEQNQTRSINQAMINAMIEDARSSSWKENLEKVSDAHEPFIFGSNAAPQRLKRLTKRVTSQTEELMSWRSLEPQS